MTAPSLAAVAALLLDASLRGAVVLAAALAATRLMRRATAASRHLVWTVALAAVLALPALSLVLPAWKVLPVPTLGRSPAPHVFTVSPPPVSALPGDERPGASGSVSPAPAGSASLAPAPSPRTDAPARRSFSFDWRTAVVALWALGGALVAARLAYGVARVWWLRRRAEEITDESWVRIVDGLARRLRVGRIVTLLRERRAAVPMTWGLISPVVLLPAEADGWSEERRTVVLAHELAHVRRWDAATQWIAHLALALFWFNPLVWLAARRLREEREHACDDAVLAIGTRPVTYADHLLDIVRALGAAEGPVAALAMARRSQFEGRLLAILDGATPRGGVSRGLGAAALVVAAAGILPLAALRAADAPPPRAGARASSTGTPSSASRPDAPKPTVDASASFAAATRPADPEEVADLAGWPAARAAEKLPDPALTLRVEATPAMLDRARAARDTTTLLAVVGEMKNDDEKATLLTTVARQDGRQGYADVARAAAGIGSSSARARALLAIVARPRLSDGDLEAVLRAMRGMDSDGDKRHVLVTSLAHHVPATASIRRAFFEVVNTIESDGERRYVLTTLLEKPSLPQETIVEVFRAAASMDSDDETRYVLTLAAEKHRLGPAARQAYLVTARTIESDGERAYALTRLVALQDDGGDRLSTTTRETGRAAADQDWNSDISLDLAGGRRVEIHAAKVRIGASQTRIVGFARGGSLVVTESAGSRRRVARGVPAADGRPRFTYTVDGEERPFESEGRDWMLGIIREFTGAK